MEEAADRIQSILEAKYEKAISKKFAISQFTKILKSRKRSFRYLDVTKSCSMDNLGNGQATTIRSI
jgi:hypothetical protein